MYRFLIAIIFFTFSTGFTSKALEVLWDFAVFKYNADTSLVELYYSFLDTTLTYSSEKSGKITANINFQATLTHLRTNQSQKFQWDYLQSKSSEDSITAFSLFGVKQLLLPRGDYLTEIIAYDNNSLGNKSIHRTEIKVFVYDKDKPALSQVELAGIIENRIPGESKWNSMFVKGDKYVIPNPPLEYSSDNPNLDFYFETYNTKTFGSGLEYQLSILDGAKREAFKTFLPVRPEADDHGRTLSVPLDLLPTGVYYLKLTLLKKDEVPVVFDEVEKKFYFYNQFIAPQLTANFTEDQLFEMSEFATMNEDLVNLEFRKARIIAGSVEIKQWDKLKELAGKQRFLYRFWEMRDEDTSTVINEYRMRYEDAIRYANTYFSYGKNYEGWNTDRGRVLLKYGEPTQIDRHPVSGTERAYEEWFFAELQGGVKFNFVDVMGFGNYILVNSDAIGEIKNSRWYEDYVLNQNSPQIEQNDY